MPPFGVATRRIDAKRIPMPRVQRACKGHWTFFGLRIILFAHILRPRKFLQSRSESYNKGFHGRISLGFGHPSAILYLLFNQYLKAVAKLNQCRAFAPAEAFAPDLRAHGRDQGRNKR